MFDAELEIAEHFHVDAGLIFGEMQICFEKEEEFECTCKQV